jgi:hypothetical protein
MHRPSNDLRGVEFLRNFRRKCQTACRAIGQQERNALRTDLSVPVVYGEKNLPIRSKPGEAPRKDEGHLQASVLSSVIDDSDSVGVQISAGGLNAPYAPVLERGGSTNFGMIAARPFMYPSLERMKRRAESQIPNLLRGGK